MVGALRDELRMFSAVVGHEWRLQRRDLIPVLMLTAMPVVLVTVLLPTYRTVLRETGGPAGNGATYAVPGFAIMFATFLLTAAGMTFFRDQSWHTWPRLRTLPIPVPILVAGKLVIPFLLLLAQLGVVFTVGVALFGLTVAGSPLALAVVLAEFALCVVAMSLLGVALSRTVVQLNAVANVLTLLFTGLGGALVPVALLPGWLQPLAPAMPSYWAMRGAQQVIVDGRDLTGVLPVIGVLGGLALVIGAAGAALLRPDRGKEAWS